MACYLQQTKQRVAFKISHWWSVLLSRKRKKTPGGAGGGGCCAQAGNRGAVCSWLLDPVRLLVGLEQNGT